MQRQGDLRNAARTTIRLLESLIRLAEAHARLLFRDEVYVVDAVVAVMLVESSMQTSALLGATSALHSAFPRNAEEEYAIQGPGRERPRHAAPTDVLTQYVALARPRGRNPYQSGWC